MAALHCALLSSFFARQGVIAVAVAAFLLLTYARRRCGHETRDLRTFGADCSKQGLQQMFGGLLMAAAGVLLSRHNGLVRASNRSITPISLSLPDVFNGTHTHTHGLFSLLF